MLHNNLDPEVAERPDDLVVYGGTGRAARSWDAFDAMARTLRTLKADETMLVQSGKPVGVFRTHEWAPRVLFANSNLVPEWGTWDEFRRLEAMGLTMYGQMTAGSWIYIGTQGILQGTYECFAEIARRRFEGHGDGTLRGTITLTAGLGGMGGAQPLAVTMNDGVALCIDVEPWRVERRLEHRYLDEIADSLDDAVARCIRARDEGRPLSVGLVGNAAEVLPKLLEMDFPADIVTDQTSAHDPLSYVPIDLTPEATAEMARTDPQELIRRSRREHGRALPGDGRLHGQGQRGVRLRQQPAHRGQARWLRAGLRLPGLPPRLHPPAVLRGQGAVPLGGAVRRPGRHRGHRPRRARGVPRRRAPAPVDRRWRASASRSRACRRASAGSATASATASACASTRWSGRGELSAPIVIGRDHLDSGLGGVAVPRDRGDDGRQSDAIADWPLLNALVNTSVGRHVGEHPPRWRRRHRPQHPRRHGVPRRRHRPGRREAVARARQRPGHGRHPPRRRRLRRGPSRWPTSGVCASRCARAC